MSEEIKGECTVENETLKLICEIEKNYDGNFTAQADLFKEFFNQLENSNKLEKVKAFVSAQTKDNRAKVINDVLNKQEQKNNPPEVLYLGIPGSLGRRFKSVEESVKKLLEILPKKQTEQDCLTAMQEENIHFNATTTTIMYLFFPECYIPIAGPVTSLLQDIKVLTPEVKIENWEKYFEVLNNLKNVPKDKNNKLFVKDGKFKPSMIIALSFTSWLKENQVDNILSKYMNSDKKAKNIILTGIPGTGKTHSVMEFLKQKEEYNDNYEFVQFHPSYDYEDFIEGFKPVSSKKESIEFKLVNGIFKDLCKKAFANKEKTFVMVIDEINRANLSRVFGELLYCLEYRNEFVSTKMTTYIKELDEGKENFSISMENENIGKFAIPDNVIILGTMNEVDRSIDAFDLALRRRFIWEDVGFSEMALRLYTPFFTNGFQSHIEDLIKKANKLNEKLADPKEGIGRNYTLGHTYYFKIIDYYDQESDDFNGALCDLWDYHIKSIVREYCKIKFGENDLSTKLEEYKKIIVEDKNNCNG